MPNLDIKLLLLDVDGVLTDGAIVYDSNGAETKRFHVRDGMGLAVWQKLGYRAGVLSGRMSPVTAMRAKELRIDLVVQGSVYEKLKNFQTICEQVGVTPGQVAFMGDDLADLPVIRACGYGMTVADGVEEARAEARYITQAPGGHGAVREGIEHLLKQMGRWPEALALYGI